MGKSWAGDGVLAIANSHCNDSAQFFLKLRRTSFSPIKSGKKLGKSLRGYRGILYAITGT